MTEQTTAYYVPDSSPWPLLASVGLFVMAVGGANFIQQSSGTGGNEGSLGGLVFAAGGLWMVCIMFLWWRDTISESLSGLHSARMDMSYRQGMVWFIFSEVMFFAAFFGALFYTRWLVVPWLGGAGSNAMTHELLWPNFQAMWPLTTTPDGSTTNAMSPWGLPAINTALLVTSSVTLTIAHHALVANQRSRLILFQLITIVLGMVFLSLQAYEYAHAYQDLALTLDAGIYGSLFFMLTGFHGLHVTIGTLFLVITFLRVLKGHCTPDNHFSWEAAAWYWHFVDVVWLFLFITVYWF